MSLYGMDTIASVDDYGNSNAVMEAFFVDDLIRANDKNRKQFMESAGCTILTEKQVLKKPTLMRLSKEDDKKRRIKLIAYQMAKDANDPHWAKLKKYQALRKQESNYIMQHYGQKAARAAEIAQKNYIKAASKVKAAAKAA